ncbi:sporulation protein [Luteimonas marina]|uniref:Sporulation protein n=1 Tax=Luteimonas marina TaxID=488485 RepID=A0A5C5U8V3_9GAMM|nr:SPOR domain-containing protein [Luteimonas marina]TWT22363.1 sporulation protein [Luteimonas marina]
MAARRGKSQARRNGGSGLPGWAWMILGIVIALVAVMVLPKYLKSEGRDGFFRPQPNAAAQPAVSAIDEGDAPPDDAPPPARRPAAAAAAAPATDTPDYDFYTVLPEQEVAMTDAELAASAREEAERQRRTLAAQRQREQDAADLATPAPTAPAAAVSTPAAAASPATRPATAAADGARYLLQAGSFSTSGDAEALKARIALLGLSARVESGDANGKTVYRVRMGPYGTATELAEAKQKLGNGGLPALAIKAN